MKLETVKIFDIAISKLDMRQTLDWLHSIVLERSVTQVITANPIMLMAAEGDPAYKKMMQQAELIVPDGTGLVWAAKHIGQPVRERVAGIDLMMGLLTLAEHHGWKVYFLGASADVISAAVKNLTDKFPRLQVCGYRDGYFNHEKDDQVITEIIEQAPDLLFIGRSASQQEPWIHLHKKKLAIPVMMGVGGSFDVLSGRLKRAPKLWQTLRVEWLYRLLQEPWRYKRMLDLPKFVWRVWRSK